MATTLQMLLELNKIDLELADVRRGMEEKPAAVAAAEKELADLETSRAALAAQAREAQVAADKSSVEIKSFEEKVQKYGVQLNITKTQKEYDAIRSEIAGCEKQISDIETAALEAYEKAEGLNRQARELDPRIAEVKKRLEAARAALAGELAELEKQKAGLLDRRAELVKPVDPDDLRRYEQALAKHPDGAMTRVGDGGLCISCNMKLSPQVYNLVLIGDPVQQCRSCGRLCYSDRKLEPAK
jgi:predicted  nucleic acid-binding Zn-ribbon protein